MATRQSASVVAKPGTAQRFAKFPPCAWPFGTALLVAALLLGMAGQAHAADQLERFLKKLQASDLFPGADAFGPLEGDPPLVPILKTGQVVAYAFLNTSLVNAAGYSGKPIHVLIALDKEAKIAGLRLMRHHEPIVLVGIPEARIREVIDGYIGFDVAEFVRSAGEGHEVDIVSGATVTVMVIDDSILRSAIKVARRLGLGGLQAQAPDNQGPRWQIDPSVDAVEDWQTLIGEGSVRRLRVSIEDINQAFAATGDEAAAAHPEPGDPGADFIDLYTAVVSIPSIGRSLLGEAEYENMTAKLKPGQDAILIGATGRYSFKGSGYVRGGIFDRFQVIQGDESYRFRDKQHKRLGAIQAAGAPRLKEVDLFYFPTDRTFDPATEWRLELLVARPVGPTRKSFLTLDVGYKPPRHYLKPVAQQEDMAEPTSGGQEAFVAGIDQVPPLWQRLWRDKVVEIAVVAAGVAVLTVIFFVQDWLTRFPELTERVRVGFLLFSLFGIGFYANAQLSVVNVMTFFNALISDFRWDYFLMEPLIFVLWFSVAASLLFWGRGPFCGWLCPFGALQELLNKLAKRLRVPQVAVPWWLHQRLWPVKYMIFLLLFGLSLYSLELAERAAEVEPFKTVIILKFLREWPFVLFAAALLAAGLFIERFYCRYLCPLGAALAIPGRLRMFDWLLRYRECGNPCQRCAKDCMVGAIHPEGQINPNECFSCLHCQTLYHHDRKCPVMIQRRLKRERREALASKSLPTAAGKAGPDLKDFLPQ